MLNSPCPDIGVRAQRCVVTRRGPDERGHATRSFPTGKKGSTQCPGTRCPLFFSVSFFFFWPNPLKTASSFLVLLGCLPSGPTTHGPAPHTTMPATKRERKKGAATNSTCLGFACPRPQTRHSRCAFPVYSSSWRRIRIPLWVLGWATGWPGPFPPAPRTLHPFGNLRLVPLRSTICQRQPPEGGRTRRITAGTHW